jgi:riboflavin kinase/FMN adenylyltransferase
MPAPDSSVLPEAIAFTNRGPSRPRGTVVAVGNFDGVHLGHAAIIARLREMAARLSAEAVAVTFDPHPAALVRPGGAPPPLTTVARRAQLLLDLGVDRVLVQPVVPAVVALSAEAFFEDVLRSRLAAAGIVEGVDFRFGRGREGNVAMLARLCAADGLELDVVEPVELAGGIVSSSRVRSLIAAGDVAAARPLLTAAYRVSGRVVEGARRGRSLGFPTANLAGIATLLPAAGVYAATAVIDEADKGAATPPACYPAAVHVGANVTFGETVLTVEAHLVGYGGDLYGRTLHVDFLQRLRDTCRFPSQEALVARLTADVQQAREVAAAVRGSTEGSGSTDGDGTSALPHSLDRHPHAS